MTYDEVLAFCDGLPGSWQDTPWEDDVVVKVGPKVFVFPGADAVSVKVEPAVGDELRAAYPSSVGTAPYLNKKHWVRVALDGDVSDDELRELLTESHRLVLNGLTRAQREEIAQNNTLANVPTSRKPTRS
jgi:predicted DNA-binding protein (MmcQ/YjbR family)